jgi:serine protease Do
LNLRFGSGARAEDAPAPAPAPRVEPTQAREEKPRTLREILDRTQKWVVALEVEREKDAPVPPMMMIGPLSKETQSYYERPAGPVTGVLVDADGHVVTSHYNVAGEVKSVRVTLSDGRKYPAKVRSRSPADDLALLEIERPPSDPEIPFSAPVWADSAALQAGQIIFVLGLSPDPRKPTLTRGIISATGRNGGRAAQIDAELNYGNSGGPVLDLDGAIVGIAGFVGHTRPQWGLNSGIGFATSAATLLATIPRMKAGEDFVAFKSAFLGVQGDRQFLEIPGAKVEKVVNGGPAAKAGLKPGDLIVEFRGTPVENFDQLRRLIFSSKVGETVKIKVRRGEETLELEPTLSELASP